MRILVYYPGDILVDRGTPLRARNLARALATQPGVELLLVSRDDPAAVRAKLGLDHERVPRDPAAAAQGVTGSVRRFAPQVVYGQTGKSMGALAGLDGKAARIADLHGDVALDIWNQTSRPFPKRVFTMARKWLEEQRSCGRMDGFTAVTSLLADKWRRHGKPIHVLWGGVDVERFQPAPQPSSDRIRVVYAGNFRPYQGVSVLLQAARRLLANDEPFRFTLIGDIEAVPDVVGAARSALGPHGDLRGQVSYDEVPALLSEADVLVIPRLPHGTAKYGFPSKLAEYLAMGRPVVVTDVGEHARVVKHGNTGLVVPPSSADALADALLQLKSAALRRDLGQAARQFATTTLSWSRLGGELQAFFADVVGRR